MSRPALRWLLLAALLLPACSPQTKRNCAPVDARHYDAFWLWAGVKPQPVLDKAQRVYVLEGEVRGAPGRLFAQRGPTPRTRDIPLFLVIRVETLDWAPGTREAIIAALARWERAGNKVVGLQIDFDARTRALDGYAAFLEQLRRDVPDRFELSVTGLMDWSANADSAALNRLGQTVDEVVLQTYQGRSTVPGYDAYIARLDRMKLPFRLGIVQGGEWCPATDPARNPAFKGYVVFLVNPR